MRKTIITRSFARKLPRPADCMSVSCCLAKWLTKWATGAQLSQSFSVIKSQMSSPWSSSWSILCEILRYWDIRIRYCEIRYCWESVEILAQSFPVSMVVWFMSGSCLVHVWFHPTSCGKYITLRSSGTESAVPPLIDARPWSSPLRLATPPIYATSTFDIFWSLRWWKMMKVSRWETSSEASFKCDTKRCKHTLFTKHRKETC